MKMPSTAFRALASLAVLAGAGFAWAGSGRASDALERPFVAGGRVRMDLSAGAYEILAGDDDTLQIEWKVRNVDQLRRVHISANVNGSEAVIRSEGPSNDFSVTIRVPARCDLDVGLTAGELRVKGIEGNKEIRLRAGDIDVDMVRAEDYAHVAASLWAGDLRAEPLGISKGGLFRQFTWAGKGRYHLNVRLLAGDIRLYTSAPRK